MPEWRAMDNQMFLPVSVGTCLKYIHQNSTVDHWPHTLWPRENGYWLDIDFEHFDLIDIGFSLD